LTAPHQDSQVWTTLKICIPKPLHGRKASGSKHWRKVQDLYFTFIFRYFVKT